NHLNREPMHLIADSFLASTDDFSWTMSRSELQRHQVLLNIGFLYPQYSHIRGVKVETIFDGPLEEVLIIYDKSHARFEWRSKTGSEGGLMVFMASSGRSALDPVRDICASAI